jgi:predicted phosphohydrolase
MNLWAIADIHLALSCPEKTMEAFGPKWSNYHERIEKNWKEVVQKEDLVLIPGDISWAFTLEQAQIDLSWIDQLPGTKVIIRGNHDSWWQSLKKVEKILPPSIIALQNTAYNVDNLSIGGSRLWETLEFNYSDLVEFKENPKANPKTPVLTLEGNEHIFERELHKLEMSLQKMNPDAQFKIVMTHYPPISYDLENSKAHQLLKKYRVNSCVFGHVHNLIPPSSSFLGLKDGINYIFTAADYLNFKPLKIK